MFSCGGRADGGKPGNNILVLTTCLLMSFTEGKETDSQEFAFTDGKSTLPLAPNNEKGATCLVPDGGALGSAGCNGDASQLFTIG